MLEIDGSTGEGGGQILRTSVALSILTQTPIHITRIRAGREKPGLQRQHLTAVQSAAMISQSTLDGDALHSSELTLTPGTVIPGNYRFSTGTAGSTTLVLQTVLPLLWTAESPSKLTLEGGTHNPMAPPVDFLNQAFIPLIEQMGPKIDLRLQRHGFYPRGGGNLEISISPVPHLKPLQILEKGRPLSHRAEAVVIGLPQDIAEREMSTLRRLLKWEHSQVASVVKTEVFNTGNYLIVGLRHEHICEVFSAIGQRGVRGENLAKALAQEVQQYLDADVPVGEHLSDQLLLPMALAGGGEFITLTPSLHTTTNIGVIEMFLPVKFAVQELTAGRFRISVTRH